MPKVVVVVLTWNKLSDTLECLDSLVEQNYSDFEILIVDNASNDETVDVIKSKYKNIRVIVNQSNLGYASGNNIGIDASLEENADYIFILNNDTSLAPDCLSRLVMEMEDNPATAAAGPKILYHDMPQIINFAGGGINDAGIPYHIGVRQPDGYLFELSKNTNWLTGCAILIRATCLKSVGCFDPRFFLLYEDVDWCLRATEAGYNLRWVAKAKLWHKESTSFGKRWTPNYFYYYSRNRLLFLECHYPKWRLPRMVKNSIVHLFNMVETEVSPQSRLSENIWRKIIWIGVRDYLLRRFGQRNYTWKVTELG